MTNPADILARLIKCPSVTPDEGGALSELETILEQLGFGVERVIFSEDDTPDIENLYARLGNSGPHLMFAGHTDVVPPGPEDDWSHAPFAAEIADGVLYGRGAVDMKGAIASFAAAVARHIHEHGRPAGSISFLITGDEEGPAINGTVKLLEWAAGRGETWDAAIVGEPTNPETLGDMIKIGRRGSLSGRVTVKGVQGHAAYPHLADNAVRGALTLATALMKPPLDAGTDEFQPSNLEVTTIDTGNPAVNVVPGQVRFDFNVRFNDIWTTDTLKKEIIRRLDGAALDKTLRPNKETPAVYTIDWRDRPSPVFLTRDEKLAGMLSAAIKAITGKTPQLSTSGGTSDARFIKDYCPVVEFGLVGQTMHMVDERVPVADLEALTQIYQRFLADWFSSQ